MVPLHQLPEAQDGDAHGLCRRGRRPQGSRGGRRRRGHHDKRRQRLPHRGREPLRDGVQRLERPPRGSRPDQLHERLLRPSPREDVHKRPLQQEGGLLRHPHRHRRGQQRHRDRSVLPSCHHRGQPVPLDERRRSHVPPRGGSAEGMEYGRGCEVSLQHRHSPLVRAVRRRRGG